MKIETVNINDLKMHPKNPRVHPDSAIEKLVRSIKEFGWTNPILVSADGYILAGHARLKAAKKAGIEEVPVIYLPLEGAKAEAYMIADNRLQQDTLWNEDILKELINDIEPKIDLLLTGFNENELQELLDIVPGFEPVPIDEQPRLDGKAKVVCPNCGHEFTP